MCHDSAVDSKEPAGAPEAKLKITPEMIEAVEKTLRCFDKEFDSAKAVSREIIDDIIEIMERGSRHSA
jgi:hypothetical protein